MKQYIKFVAVSLLAGMCLSSCTETDAEKDKGSTPVIKYARVCDPSKSDSLIVAASLGSKIVFVGDNLGDVQQIWFNDQKALLNPVMVTSNTIVVDVPNVIPSEVNNTARFITSTGIETDVPFQVTVPGPRIDKIDCEWTRPGDQAVITGAYFANDPTFPLTVTFPGNLEARIVSFDQTTATVVVPEGAVEGPITVSTIYGKGKSSFHYADTRGMLFDFDVDGATGLGIDGRCWHNQAFVSDELSLDGTYLRLGDGATALNDDAWDDNHFHFEYWAGEWTEPVTYPARLGDRLFDLVDFSDYKNMSLKFEMLVPSAYPWQACSMQIIFSGTDKVSYGPAGPDVYGNIVAGSNNSYFQDDSGKAAGWGRAIYRPWSETAAFDTGDKWITVTVPLTEFVYNSVGGKASASPASAADFANFEIFVWSGGAKGAECTPIICIDNIRAVRN